MANNLETKKIFAIATDPVYIGTGGFTIGRVDNTIVRDPITNIPKIPGSSLAGTWRYYMALELISNIKDKQPSFEDIKRIDATTVEDKLKQYNWKNCDKKPDGWQGYYGNQIAKITCAGQDEPNQEIDKYKTTGHCGHCIVCKSFGFSKNDKSNQGMLFFSDLNILFFPVYTRMGVKWITSPMLLQKNITTIEENKILTYSGNEKYLNLGWLNLEVSGKHTIENVNKYEIKKESIVIVPDSLISQIINSNLEVRTSVSIDPITGTAKEGALFTSEAIPRGTIFCGEVSGFSREGDNSLPELKYIFEALEDSKQYYKSLGIGGMTTRGFGRVKILGDLK